MTDSFTKKSEGLKFTVHQGISGPNHLEIILELNFHMEPGSMDLPSVTSSAYSSSSPTDTPLAIVEKRISGSDNAAIFENKKCCCVSFHRRTQSHNQFTDRMFFQTNQQGVNGEVWGDQFHPSGWWSRQLHGICHCIDSCFQLLSHHEYLQQHKSLHHLSWGWNKSRTFLFQWYCDKLNSNEFLFSNAPMHFRVFPALQEPFSVNLKPASEPFVYQYRAVGKTPPRFLLIFWMKKYSRFCVDKSV